MAILAASLILSVTYREESMTGVQTSPTISSSFFVFVCTYLEDLLSVFYP